MDKINSETSEKKKKPYQNMSIFCAIAFIFGVLPLILPLNDSIRALCYGVYFFLLLLFISIWLMLHVEPIVADHKVERDYRVVHFILRLALTFGIGAVIVAIIVVADQLHLLPLFK